MGSPTSAYQRLQPPRPQLKYLKKPAERVSVSSHSTFQSSEKETYWYSPGQVHGKKHGDGAKQWLSSVGATASLKYCASLAQNSDLRWALLGVAAEWQSCHRAHVADALGKTQRDVSLSLSLSLSLCVCIAHILH